jgi:hypothetical protein
VRRDRGEQPPGWARGRRGILGPTVMIVAIPGRFRVRGLGACVAAVLACGGGGSGDDVDGGDGPPVGGSSDVFDESVIRTYDIEVADSDWQWLNDNATLEEYVPAALRFEGASYSEVAIRYKGSFGSLYSCFDGQGNRICDKLSIKLKFNEYVPEARFRGLKRINLHSMEADPTNMHDAIGYKLFRDVGVAAPRTAYARVVINGELIGLYAVVEQIDGRFTRAMFPDGGEGNLYKEVWPSHASEQPYLDALKTNEDENPSADKMVRFAQALADGGEAGFAEVIEQWIGTEYLARYMAVARLIDSWDDIVGWYCVGGTCFNHNYYWYESTAEDRVWLIAWDLDHTFEEPSPIRTYYGIADWDEVDADCTPVDVFLGIQGRAPACDPFIRHMATQLWDQYAAESQALLDGPFSAAAMNARIGELETLIEDAVAEDPNRPPLSEWREAVEALGPVVEAKRAHVAGKL